MISRSQMNRQLYADGTGIAQLLKMQQSAAQDELTEEQAFAMMPEGVKEAFASMVEAGASPQEARRLISQQLAEMSIQQMQMQREDPRLQEALKERFDPKTRENLFIPPRDMRESQDIPEYYDPRLQILSPEQMREEMQNPSMPGYAYGGLIGRQQYGLGSLVKSFTKGVTGAVKGAVGAVKDIASSNLGKVALLGAATFGIPGTSFGGFGFLNPVKQFIGGISPFAIPGTGSAMPGGNFFTAGSNLFSGVGSLAKKVGSSNLLSLGLGFLGGSATKMLTPEQIQTGMQRNPTAVRNYLRQYYLNSNPEATEDEAEQYANEQTREYAAEGGLMGRQNYGIGGMITKFINENPEIFKQLQMASPMRQYTGQYYGNLNPGKSVEEIEEYVRENAAYGGPMGELRTNQEGVGEIDYRQTGGFVPPIGIKEKADDVPAMLSNNEFVFTADAVRNAGGGDVNKGAQKMYSLMKTLENGGMA